MKRREIERIDVTSVTLVNRGKLMRRLEALGTDGASGPDGADSPELRSFALAADEVEVPNTLYFRFVLTIEAGGRTDDELEWAASATGPWQPLKKGGKVIIAEFDRAANTRVVLSGTARVVTYPGPSTNFPQVALTVRDWELNRVRQPLQTGAPNITITPGPFSLPAMGLVTAFHELNFNASALYNGQEFDFDPLVIIVPKRP